MFENTKGNILKADVEAIINTVNCVGVMGKGIALQFKFAYPENFTYYKKACDIKEVKPGKMNVFRTGNLFNPKYIINFPTKNHWKGKSKINDIKTGLLDLKKVMRDNNITSIAIPPLGCGNGGLNWVEVKNLITESLESLPEVRILIYAPIGSPDVETMPVKSTIPNMTRLRALLIKIIEKYCEPGYKLSLLEVQKLAYFLQESGENLKLEFVKEKFGPYAEKLNFVLQRLEGHYIRGYGDRSRDSQIRVLENSLRDVENFLSKEKETQDNFNRVNSLIEGFESPYGMELLATVHWIMKNNSEISKDLDEIIKKVHSWNTRKKKLLKPKHIEIAYNRLIQNQWI